MIIYAVAFFLTTLGIIYVQVRLCGDNAVWAGEEFVMTASVGTVEVQGRGRFQPLLSTSQGRMHSHGESLAAALVTASPPSCTCHAHSG